MALILPLPAADADWPTLREHWADVNRVLAGRAYEDARHTCMTCCRLDENTIGKSPYNHRALFCSHECEAVFERYTSLLRTRGRG